jgi:hypothetical protein
MFRSLWFSICVYVRSERYDFFALQGLRAVGPEKDSGASEQSLCRHRQLRQVRTLLSSPGLRIRIHVFRIQNFQKVGSGSRFFPGLLVE